MTDIHCHILYGVDDGAKTPDDTQAMLDMAYKDGIRTIIATPHYNEDYGYGAEEIKNRLKDVSEQISDKMPGMKLYPGNECFLDDKLLDALRTGKCLTLAGSRYVLTEISTIVLSRITLNMLTDLLSSGYTPIIAHCERLIRDKSDIKKVSMLKDMGCLLQVNASAVLEKSSRWFDRWLYNGLFSGDITFIASDAHNLSTRPPALCEAYEAVIRKTDRETADRVFRTNAEALLSGLIRE
jgi:protein-tyrosine phosphatase